MNVYSNHSFKAYKTLFSGFLIEYFSNKTYKKSSYRKSSSINNAGSTSSSGGIDGKELIWSLLEIIAGMYCKM